MANWRYFGVINVLAPQDRLDEEDIQKGLRMMLFDSVFANLMVALTGGAFLIGFALLLDASVTVIGFISAIPPLTQLLQIPATLLIEKMRLRKMLVVVTALLSRIAWAGIIVIPWLLPKHLQLPAFFVCIFAFYGIGAFAGCAYNSWVRDLIPEKLMGRYFAQRMAWAIGLAAVASMTGGTIVDFFKNSMGSEMVGYSIIFAIGTALGIFAVVFLARMPEPRMHAPAETDLWGVFAQPFRDLNFRQLLIFLGSWNFAVNFAAPFFAVYMLQRIDLSMTWVLALAVVSQITNVLFIRLWGRLADKYTNKSVLSVAGPLFILTFLLWPFTSMLDRFRLAIPILVVIHVLGGISTAGLLVSATNIALKLAPQGKATAYLAMNALVSGSAATIAPILAGLSMAGFKNQELSLAFHWRSRGLQPMSFDLPAFVIKDLDFLFVLAFMLGLYAIHRLIAVKEEGEVEEDIVVHEFYAELRRSARSVSQVFGLRALGSFPLKILKGMAPDREDTLVG